MWTTKRTLNASVFSRPARLVYLVPEKPPEKLLDALFAECLSRWGGRRTPIIPTNGHKISPKYWPLLELWDADILYSYVKLSEKLEIDLYDKLAPSEIRIHDGLTQHLDAHDLQPDYSGNFEFVSSLSLLPLFERRALSVGSGIPEIADRDFGSDIDRDLHDTFGFVSNSYYGGSLLPHACRLAIRPEHQHQESPRQSDTIETSYFEDEQSFIETLSRRPQILTLSRLADMLCPHLNCLVHGRRGWADHMTIVIGDSMSDRLLHWNAQHRYPALGVMDDLPVIRLSPKRFANGTPEWLRDWISIRNHRHLSGNSAPRTVVKSCSLDGKSLEYIVKCLSQNRTVMVSHEQFTTPYVFEPCTEKVGDFSSRHSVTNLSTTWNNAQTKGITRIRFQNNQVELPLTPPWHIASFPYSKFSYGVWASDLSIERAEDHSRYSNQRHVWKFSKRLRLESAIGFENYLANEQLVIPPPPRPTANGDLAVWDNVGWTRPVLNLPSDYQAFVLAISKLAPNSPRAQRAYSKSASVNRFGHISLSDKGRDLLGVCQFFGSLPEALSYLTDPFWLTAINRLSPDDPQRKERSIDDLAQAIAGLPEDDLEISERHRAIAKRALHLAARAFSSQNQQLKTANFEQLMSWAVDMFGPDRGNELKDQLAQSTTHLRDRGFLWQGFKWRCTFCQHANWVPLNQLSITALCEICRNEKPSPVSRSLDFRLNPFVQHAFAPSSAQGSVIWCAKQLADRAQVSFAFCPAIDLYRADSREPVSDIDLVASVDGKIFLAEVKSSFAGLNPKAIEQYKSLMIELRPDVAMLAVHQEEPSCQELKSNLEKLATDLATHSIRLELLTPNIDEQSQVIGNVAQPYAKQMKWSAW